MKPRIIKKTSKKFKESGCCFRSCGGSPLIQQDNPLKIIKGRFINRLLRKI